MYDGQSILGFRDNGSKPWSIYAGPFSVFAGYENYNKVRARLREEFFHRFKYQSRWFWNQKRNDYDSLNFGYNVNERHFWDSSIVWNKGFTISEYYMFQLRGNVKPDYFEPILNMPPIRYSDDLLKLYRELNYTTGSSVSQE